MNVMKTYRNLGHHERVIRVGVGLLLLAVAGLSSMPEWVDLALMSVGLIAFLTGLIGYCPAWQLFGINTCPLEKSEQSTSHIDPELHEQSETSSHRS